jgi:hypothetical protein
MRYDATMPGTTQRLLATMVTTTTYGTWLPGDLRGYVEDGIILPANPDRLERSCRLLKSDPIFLTAHEQETIFEALQRAAHEFDYDLFAASIESWHAHWLIDHAFDAVQVMVGRLKTRMRQALDRGRLWTAGYDARFCFDHDALERRRNYIHRHHGSRRLPDTGPAS